MKKITLSVLISVMTIPALADDVLSLNVTLNSGEKKIEVAQISNIKYTDTDMVINMKDGSVLSIPMNDVVIMNFGQETADVALLFGAEKDSKYSICDIKGNVIASGVLKAGKLPQIPGMKGLYIVTVGETTKKVLVK